MPKIQNYEVIDNGLIITSSSGSQYRITKSACSCKGFGFRRNCGHYTEAKTLGLLDLIIDKPISVFLQSPYIKAERIKSIRYFLTKQKIDFTEELLIALEPRMTRETRPEQLITWATQENL